MKSLELARKYMEIFFSGGDIEELSQILAKDLVFEGPFYRFNSAKDYLESLRKDPPEGMEYDLLKSFENKSGACLIYRFFKQDISIPMAQIFETKDDRISKIVLIFDARAFS